MNNLTETERQIEEIWHNMYRMHGYVEAAFNIQGEERPQILKHADVLLQATYQRVISVLSDTRRLERPFKG